MINSKELRRGNYFLNIDGEVDQVSSIDGDAVNEYEQKYLHHIPLSAEWLEKLGFELEYKSDFRTRYTHTEKQFIGYDYDPGVGGWKFRFYGHYIPCKFVYQLQNLYHALTGEELTIKEKQAA